jgi:hypothetical protein
MSQQIRTWVKYVSGIEYDDISDAEKLIVRQENRDNIAFEFWDYEVKRGEMTVPNNVAIVLARSIQLCIDGKLDQIGINL